MQAGRQGSWQRGQCGFTSSQVLSPTWKLQALGCKPLWVVTPVGRLYPRWRLRGGWEAQAPTLMPQGQYEDNQTAPSPKQKFSPSQVPESLLGALPLWTTAQPGPHKALGLISTPQKCSPSASFTIPGEHLCTRDAVSISSLWLARYAESQSLPEQCQPAGHLSQLLPFPPRPETQT